MHTLRKIASIVLMLLAALIAVVGWVVSNPAGVESTVKANLELNKKFGKAAQTVSDFHHRLNRYPSQEELNHECEQCNFYLVSDKAAFPKEAVELLGQPCKSCVDQFLLIDWGYDIPKYWAAWSKQSNAATNSASFYILGSSKRDALLFGTISLVAALSSAIVRRGPTKKADQ